MTSVLWEICLFGGLSLQCGGRRESRFRTQKTAALLSYLALFPSRTHPREELAVRFWGEDGDEEARRSLRVSLNSLRRQLETPNASEGELILADRTSIGLRREAFLSDVFCFEDALTKSARISRTAPDDREGRVALLLEAVALYSAPLLPGFYDDWVTDERERLHSRFLDALEEAESLLRKLGRTAQADSLLLRRQQSESSDRVAGTGIPRPRLPGPHPNGADGAKETSDGAVAIFPMPERRTADQDSLPHFFTRFFGRDREMAQILTSLDDPFVSVVTLLGPGGIGKTRLSVEAARAWGKSAVWVPLASVVRGEEIADALRNALKMPPASGAMGDDWELVTARLQELATTGTVPLLMLDNFEQVEPDSGARFVARLLRAAPGVRCLISSRRRLGVPGESLFAVEAFPLPGETETDPVELLRNPSVALFADRARSATPDFAVTPRNAASVANLCRLLDGLPLAIELAAAWASAFTPGQMAQKLAAQGERWGLLASRKTADRVERHRSLWNAIAWSYDLLPPDLRELWRWLSVFHGGFTADMAKTIASTTFSSDGLARLRERSLVRLMEESEGDDPDDTRYELLESLREFAAERVSEEEALEKSVALREWHLSVLQAIADDAAANAYTVRSRPVLQRLLRELPNFRAALGAAEAGDVPVAGGLLLAGRLNRLWVNGGHLREGYGVLSALLHRAEVTGEPVPPLTRARALYALGEMCRMRLENDIAQVHLQSAVTLYRAANEKRGVMQCLSPLGALAESRGDIAVSESCHREALALSRELDHKAGIAVSLHNLGLLKENAEGGSAAVTFYEQEIVVRREIGDDRGIALALDGLAGVANQGGDFAAAKAHWSEAMERLHRCGDRFRMAYLLTNYASLLRSLADWETATVVYGAARHLFAEQGTEPVDKGGASMQDGETQCRTFLGPKRFTSAWERGSAMPLGDLVAFLTK
ncbi:MAG: winged helix-turn-helix domain-containing protein [Akkermansiaceae bacterium]|nr:winged helix-turn-helix domain-containing protein [Armatimonadota bacterium]